MNDQPFKELLKLPLFELIRQADSVRRESCRGGIELCGIMNAKSGLCPEDCGFCAQSARHASGVAEYPLKSPQEMVSAAGKALENGANRFGIVTSGNSLAKEEIETVALGIEKISREVGIPVCASLGAVEKDDLLTLKEAGLKRYHHNIETSRNFFPKIVTTHGFEERTRTTMAARNAGLEVCSGGIIGLGESWPDRISMALELRELGVDSVPLNFLVPIKGTPLQGLSLLSAAEALKTIALFRMILKDRTIRIAAGREIVLAGFEHEMFKAGANGLMIGDYLTIKGGSVRKDLELVREISKTWKNG